MAVNDLVRDVARSYADAWCSHDPAERGPLRPGGTIAINGGEPTEITEVSARSSPPSHIQVFVDDLIYKDETVEFHWTFTGTNTDQGHRKVGRIPGFESGRSLHVSLRPGRLRPPARARGARAVAAPVIPRSGD